MLDVPMSQKDAKDALRTKMSGIARDCLAADWPHDIDIILWLAIVRPNLEEIVHGDSEITYKDRYELLYLHRACNGWWATAPEDHPDDVAIFKPLPEWLEHLRRKLMGRDDLGPPDFEVDL